MEASGGDEDGGGCVGEGAIKRVFPSISSSHAKRTISECHTRESLLQFIFFFCYSALLMPAKLGHIRNGEPPITCPQSISRMIPSFLRRARVGRDHHVSIQRASQSEKCKVLDTLFYGCSPLEISRPPIQSSMTLE